MKKQQILRKTFEQVTHEIHACIGCNECLLACPVVDDSITIDMLNNETLNARVSNHVARFANLCCQCGACVSPCPVGLHRDAMMLWLKMRLL